MVRMVGVLVCDFVFFSFMFRLLELYGSIVEFIVIGVVFFGVGVGVMGI